MFANICLRKQKLALAVLLFLGGIIVLREQFKQKKVQLDKKVTCQKVNQVFKTMDFLGSAEVRKPLIKPGKFTMEEVLKWQPMLTQECPWKLNATAVTQYRKELGQCCNASQLLVVTKENTPLGSIINFDGDTYKNITVDVRLRSVLLKAVGAIKLFQRGERATNDPLGNDVDPQECCPICHCAIGKPYTSARFPLADTRYSKCSIVGNGGILYGSRCGQAIDQANFVIRFNLPPLSRTKDVGTKTHLVTINPSILSNRFKDLVGSPADFIDALRAYPNALFLIPALSFNYHLKVSYHVISIMKDVGQAHRVFFLHPHYLSALDTYWKLKRMKEIRLSTGFMFTSFALEFCDDITLYGFWPFLYDLNGKPISHHYYDNVLPHPFVHNMSEEFSRYLTMSAQGALRIHLGKCQ